MEAYREPAPRRAARAGGTLLRAVRNGRARAKTQPAPPPVDGRALRALLTGAGAEATLVEVPANRPPWTPGGPTVQAGDRVSWLAWGRVALIKPLGVAVGPDMGLLGRVGGADPGPPLQSARDTWTFTADRTGPVQLAGRFPGWVQPDGSIATDRLPYRALAGRLAAVVARWPPGVDPAQALAALAPRDPSGLCAAEAARLADPPAPPPGWHHHPSTGAAPLWTPTERGIRLDCRDSGGILRRPAEAELTPTLRLRWSWRVEELPSRLPEDTAITHDYLSVAVEFDDGQDLTWQWSCGLPEGFAYRCPMDYWRRIETHIVVRRGAADLGRWVQEERPVLADHRAAIGGTTPARVVRAWLIAVTFHQGGTGRGEFGPIELVDGDRVVRVL